MRCRCFKKNRRGFTLTELLAVIAIIGIMLAMALPELVNTTGNSRLNAAAHAVESATNLARQHAIADGQPTYLVLRDFASAGDETQVCRSYAVFTINTHTTPVSQMAGQFLTDWEMLPEGIVFDDTVGNSDNLFFVSEGAAWNGAISKNNLLKIGSKTYIVQGFKPTGEAGSNTHWIFLAEGFYDDGRQLVRTSKQGKKIKFDITGKSIIVDYAYEDSGAIKELTK